MLLTAQAVVAATRRHSLNHNKVLQYDKKRRLVQARCRGERAASSVRDRLSRRIQVAQLRFRPYQRPLRNQR